MSEIISSDLDESEKSIFWCKKSRNSAVSWKIGIVALNKAEKERNFNFK